MGSFSLSSDSYEVMFWLAAVKEPAPAITGATSAARPSPACGPEGVSVQEGWMVDSTSSRLKRADGYQG